MDRPVQTEETQPLPNDHPDYAEDYVEWLNSHSAETMAKALRERYGENVLAGILNG